MNAEKLKQAEEIYRAARNVSFNERETFFKKCCGEDGELRREVESRLASEKKSRRFSSASSDSGAVAAAAEEILSPEKSQSSLVNTQISRYRIKSLLGRGGMGEVYLAEDTTLNRQVALKFLSAAVSADRDRLRRFEQEAFSASALNHPNILTIYEFGSENGTYFLAAEFVEGETLRELINRRELSLREMLRVAEQTAFALAAAHRGGIVHRDIKPDNIMRREDGIVKILDFGLAKLIESGIANAASRNDDKETLIKSPEKNPGSAAPNAQLTSPGMIMGTAAYMSPEQTRGLSDVDSRTDVWSLGVVIFEMIAGRTPFAGETVSDIIASILKTEAPHVSRFVPECPPELDRIVAKALKKDREERYQSIKDLALDLKSLRREQEFSAEFDRQTGGAERQITAPIPVQTATASENRRQFSAFYKVSIQLAAAAVVLVFLGAWWYFGEKNNVGPATENAALPKAVEITNWNSSPGEFYSVGSFSPDGKMIAFASTKTGTKNLWIKQTNAGEAVQITKDEFNNDQPIWSPGGDELAFFSTRGNQTGLWRIPIFGGSPKFIGAIGDGSSVLRRWSKKDLIYYESEGDIYAIDANSGQSKLITDFAAKAFNVSSIGISPDERRVAYVTTEGDRWSIWTKNINSDAPQKLFTAAGEIRNTVFHPDNQRVFYSQPVDGTFQIFVADTSAAGAAAVPRQITSGERDCFVVDVSADGAKILYGSAKEESDVWSVNLKDGKESIIASDIAAELWAMPAPDGKTIAYQSIKNLSQGDKLFKGEILTKKLNSDQAPNSLVAEAGLPVWSPDGRKIVFVQIAGNKYQISTMNAAGGGSKHLAADDVTSIGNSILPYNRVQTSDFSWSPDSSKIAYPSRRSGHSNIWIVNPDGSNNTQLTDNSDAKLYFYCPLWSADGKSIVFTSKTGVRAAEGKPAFGVWTIDAETKKSRQLTRQNSFLRSIGWSEKGDEVILASAAGSGAFDLQAEVFLSRLQTETGAIQPLATIKNAYLYNIHLAPDGKTIAFAAHRDGMDNLWLLAATAAGGEEKKLTGNNDSRLYFSSLAWSPDGSSIFYGKQSRYSLLSMLVDFK